MINFVLKYTGTYGLLAILALAIITPTYLFLSNEKEKLLEDPVSIVKTEETKTEETKTEETKTEETKTEETIEKSVNEEKATQEDKKIFLEETESLSVDVFRVDELGNIISAGKVSKKAKVEILANNKKVIGADKTEDDGSFVVFGKAQTTGLVQTVKIRGFIEVQGQEKIVDSADLFFVIPQVEKNNEREENKIVKTPIIVKDDGKELKVLAPIRVSPVNSVTLDSISYTENSNTELAGRARLANTVRVYLNNKFEIEVKVNESGAWKALLVNTQAGVYKLRLDELNENETVEGRLELPFKREEESLIQAMGEGSITVQPGNSLWRIARKYYGTGIQYVEIFDRNSHLIKNPDLIYPGQVFSLPN